MKKNVATYRLNRDTKARKALFKNLIIALTKHESIETTSAKAAAVRPLFERLLTKAKQGTLAARRSVQAVLQNKSLVKKMVDDIARRYEGVRGGYTKIIQVGQRRGDGAKIVRLTLTKQKPTEVKKEVKSTQENTKEEAKPIVKTPKAVVAPKKESANTNKIVAPRTGRRGDR